MTTIGSATIGAVIATHGPRANNFDLIRLSAAVLVLVSHAVPLTSGSDEFEPLFWLSGGQSTLGGLAVAVFFFVSGMLVTQSWQHSRGLGPFLWKRALRLFPALIIAVMLTTFVLGPLVTTLSADSYFGNAGSWGYLWNMALRTVDTLPGVFRGLPFPDAVNGSLWTLPYEVRCYLIVALLGMAGLLGWRSIIGLVAMAWCAALTLALADRLGDWTSPPLIRQQTELFLYFGLGVLVWLLRDRVPVGPLPLAVGLVLFAAAVALPAYAPLAALSLALAVPSLAYVQSAWPHRFTASGDYSYGIYLYAFPVQQVVASLGPTGGPWWFNIVIALPITLLLAALSWHCVERPALAFKALAQPKPLLQGA